MPWHNPSPPRAGFSFARQIPSNRKPVADCCCAAA
nr:MAG TPA: hypothetical protein [Caudoviricetes sp.]